MNKKNNIDLANVITPVLNDIINGYIMGDGHIKQSGTLTVDQGSAQRNFVLWMHEQLKPLCTPDSKVSQVTRKRRRGDKVTTTKSYRFNTKAVLQDYYNTWYQPVEGSPNSQKRLPKNIADMFNPLFITVWFACDGTKPNDYRGSRFEVTAFTADERIVLQKLFKDKYDILVNIIRNGVSKKGTVQWALSIDSDNYDKFRALITQHDLIETLFPYKLHKKNP